MTTGLMPSGPKRTEGGRTSDEHPLAVVREYCGPSDVVQPLAQLGGGSRLAMHHEVVLGGVAARSAHSTSSSVSACAEKGRKVHDLRSDRHAPAVDLQLGRALDETAAAGALRLVAVRITVFRGSGSRRAR